MSASIDGISAMVDASKTNAAANRQTASLQSSLKGVSSESTEEELQEVCKDFASYFVEEVLKEVKENILPEEEEGDQSISTLTDFHMDSVMELMADEVVDEVGGNFTQQLYEQMKRNYGIE